MARRRKRPPPVCQSECRCRPYQPMPSGTARRTTVTTNSAKSLPTETEPLRATAIPIWVKNATTARKAVIDQSVLGSVRKNAFMGVFLVAVFQQINSDRSFLQVQAHQDSLPASHRARSE